MATARQQKGTGVKKGPDSNTQGANPVRRLNAWGNRGTPPPGAYNANANLGRMQNGYSSPSHTNGKHPTTNEDKDRLLASLAGSIGSTITVQLNTNNRYEGVLTAVSTSDDASISLKDARDLSTPGAPLKDSITILASNVRSFTPGPASSGGAKGADIFRTDVEISRSAQAKRERELLAWQPDPATSDSTVLQDTTSGPLHRGDDVTFGPNANAGGSWDQFAVNEELFGITTKFDEDVYTTKLDRSGKDYREKEKLAERIAAEITGSVTNNPHIAEERGLSVDDSGINEEDKYGAVVRGVNAYIPPGARKIFPAAQTPQAGGPNKDKEADKESKPEVPKVSINAADGTERNLPRMTTSPPGSSGPPAKQPPADALPAFRDFVTHEKQRLTQKKQAIVKSEMEKRVADLVKFSQNFKLNKPIPEDLVPILAKDEEKQKQIREKSTQDAQSAQARSIGISASIVSTTHAAKQAPVAKSSSQQKPPAAAAVTSAGSSTKPPPSGVPASKSTAAIGASPAVPAATQASNGAGGIPHSKTVPRISMVIQPIPPFRGGKSKQSSPVQKAPTAQSSTQPLSPTSAQRLNVNATSFRPNPKAVAFTPTSGSPSSSAVSPKPKTDAHPTTPAAPNPFFGTQVIKKTPPVNVKDDFNPFKHAKPVEPAHVSAIWPYNGKRYMLMFPPPPAPPQTSPHITPHHAPPPPPPPSYDEDAAAQAATRGYAVYAYAPYPYAGQPPHQHMMAGMPGMPPGAFVPSPYMQPMPYPPNMPPPSGQPMYAPPPMGQMPREYNSYMQPPPPPGPYPPNNGGPRPSMPPTPIPAHAHAHPYYHQSPQLQHAVPYPMMMPPPGPSGPPHPYEGVPPPPVPMGGVGHA